MKSSQRWCVEVEPLSEARWSRVERELFAKIEGEALAAGGPVSSRAGAGNISPSRTGRSVARAWWAAAALVSAALVVVVFAHRTMRREAAAGEPSARWGDRFTLATTDSTSQFTVGESALTVAPRSLVMVSGDDDQGIDVVLDRGRVTCEVAPRKGRPPFRLEAGEVRVRVTGTKFTVARDETTTTVDVERGSVEVTSRGVVSQLQEGGHWPSGVAQAASVPAPAALQSAETSAAAMESPAPSRLHSRRRGHKPHPALTATTPPAPAEPAPREATPSELPAPAAGSGGASESQRAFEAAAKLERSNPEAAAVAYRELANGATAWAPNALFALGRLEVDRGHRAEAIRLFDAYLGRYPHGINADDARELLRHMR